MDDDLGCARALIFATILGIVAWTGVIALIAALA